MTFLVVALLAGPAFSYESVVEKQVFTLTDFVTRGGQTIPEMRRGYETDGTLNAARDNAILTRISSAGTFGLYRATEDAYQVF